MLEPTVSETSSQDLVQAVRPVYKNRSTTHDPLPEDLMYLAIHHDPTIGKDIILWDDILVVFDNALYVKHGAIVIPFLKGPDFAK